MTIIIVCIAALFVGILSAYVLNDLFPSVEEEYFGESLLNNDKEKENE